MSYQVLARKWRPRSFDEVRGQAHVTTALRNAIRSERIPHALLFTGPRGTGKTTLARIFACCLNCEKGPTDTPDPEDPACRGIAAGTSTDVQEIDAASRTSVDDVREIIESIHYAASPGKHRIYIVDEVHMLSRSAFNALLKTLEEPPPQSLFIFCTTDPEKIPFTVVSRCQRYDLRRIPTAEAAAALGEIATAEGLTISHASLLAVARAGDGSLRDALTLLDQLIAAGGTEIDDERVAEVLDLIDRQVLLTILEHCIAGDAAAALGAARHAFEAGVGARRLGGALLGALRDLVVTRVAPGKGLVEGVDAELEALADLAKRTEEARLRRMFRALLKEQQDLTWAPEPFAVLEMALIRLAGMPSGDQVTQLLTRLDHLERQLRGESSPAASGSDGGDGGGNRGGTGRSGSTPRQGTRRQGTAHRPKAPPAQPERQAPDPPERTQPTASALGARSEPQASEAHDRMSPPTSQAGLADDTFPLHLIFDRLRAFAQEANRGLFAALEGGHLVEKGTGDVRIALSSPTAVRRLESRHAELEAICAAFFGTPMRVALEVDHAGPSPPADQAEPSEAGAEQRRRRQQALQHPFVNDALEILGGEILEIRPLGAAQ